MAMNDRGVVLITGSAMGIGRAIALRLAEDGFHIALNDLESSKEHLKTLAREISQKGRRTSIIFGDVAQEADVKRMVDSTAQELGGLDVMVANAGIRGQRLSVQDDSVENWDRIFSVNARGVFLCYTYAARQMIKQGRGGRIIGASSIAGKRGQARSSAYSSSKFAVRGLTQSAAKDLGPHKITVNAYAPGAIDTPMLTSIIEKLDAGSVEAFNSAWITGAPVGCLGKPSDVASIVSYLASKEAHFITGTRLHLSVHRIAKRCGSCTGQSVRPHPQELCRKLTTIMSQISVNGGVYFD